MPSIPLQGRAVAKRKARVVSAVVNPTSVRSRGEEEDE
jgi:hypothetical protein